MVAQPGRVDLEALAGDRECADRFAVLLEVSLGELLPRLLGAGAHPALAVAAPHLAAVAGREPEPADVEVDRDVRIFPERVPRLRHLERVDAETPAAALRAAMPP